MSRVQTLKKQNYVYYGKKITRHLSMVQRVLFGVDVKGRLRMV